MALLAPRRRGDFTGHPDPDLIWSRQCHSCVTSAGLALKVFMSIFRCAHHRSATVPEQRNGCTSGAWFDSIGAACSPEPGATLPARPGPHQTRAKAFRGAMTPYSRSKLQEKPAGVRTRICPVHAKPDRCNACPPPGLRRLGQFAVRFGFTQPPTTMTPGRPKSRRSCPGPRRPPCADRSPALPQWNWVPSIRCRAGTSTGS